MSMNYTHIHFNKIIIFSSLLIISMMLSYVESLLPFNVYGIGIKVGLANIVTIVAIFILSYINAMFIGLLRVAFLSYIFGNLIYFQLSMAGFMASFIIMSLTLYVFNIDAKHTDNNYTFKIILTSVLGSIFHNIAQIVVCYFILGRQAIILNLLYLLIPIGIFTGMIVGYLSIKVLKIIKNNK